MTCFPLELRGWAIFDCVSREKFSSSSFGIWPLTFALSYHSPPGTWSNLRKACHWRLGSQSRSPAWWQASRHSWSRTPAHQSHSHHQPQPQAQPQAQARGQGGVAAVGVSVGGDGGNAAPVQVVCTAANNMIGRMDAGSLQQNNNSNNQIGTGVSEHFESSKEVFIINTKLAQIQSPSHALNRWYTWAALSFPRRRIKYTLHKMSVLRMSQLQNLFPFVGEKSMYPLYPLKF